MKQILTWGLLVSLLFVTGCARFSVDAANAELPSGVLYKDKLFVAYITKVGEKRSVWLAKVG